jgi:hypothetical protein
MCLCASVEYALLLSDLASSYEATASHSMALEADQMALRVGSCVCMYGCMHVYVYVCM